MTSLVRLQRRARPAAPAASAAGGGTAAAPAPAVLPGYLQRKLEIGADGNQHEREADRVAARALRAQPASSTPRIGGLPAPPRRDEPVQRRSLEPKRAQPEELVVQRKSLERDELQRKSLERREEQLQRRADDGVEDGEGAASARLERRIGARRGGGESLPEDTRSDLESRFGEDFSGVRIHRDAEAASLASEVSARAFTVGHDVYFGQGEFAPDHAGGRELLAHELAHVVQQRGGSDAGGTLQRRRKLRSEKAELRELKQLELPRVKGLYQGTYTKWIGKNLVRPAGYSRASANEERDQNQREIWRANVQVAPGSLKRLHLTGEFDSKTIYVGGQVRTHDKATWIDELTVPRWGPSFTPLKERLQVDHIVELQVSKTPAAADDPGNLELLDAGSNRSAGYWINRQIRQDVAWYLKAKAKAETPSRDFKADWNAPEVTAWLAANDIKFKSVEVVGRGRPAASAQRWTAADIRRGRHLKDARVLENDGEAGTASRFAIVSNAIKGSGGKRFEIATFSHKASAEQFGVWQKQRKNIPGLIVERIELVENSTEVATGARKGTAKVKWDFPQRIEASRETFELALYGAGQYSARLQDPETVRTTFKGMSPLTFATPRITPGGVAAAGALSPSIGLLAAAGIDVQWVGNEVRFQKQIAVDQLTLDLPGLKLGGAGVELWFQRSTGFGAAGTIELEVPQLGAGSLTVGASEKKGFFAQGSFSFDTELFDEAEIKLKYEEGRFSGAGILAITKPDKIPGIQRGRIEAEFDGPNFKASGTVQPKIDALDNVALTVSYDKEQGLVIAGELGLAPGALGLESGMAKATLVKQGDAWQVELTGEATASVAGIQSKLRFQYDDGIILISARSKFARGRLSGFAVVGVTNAVLDDEGQPTKQRGKALSIWGGGELTLKLASWLQGTAGVYFQPDGQLLLVGEIALPSSLEVFSRQQVRDVLFDRDIDIPLVGVSVLGKSIGVFATVGGSIVIHAGIGPGLVTGAGLRVEYNPDREEDTKVTGTANFGMKANAGLDLSLRGGLGVGIPIVDARAFLKATAGVGVEAEATGEVEANWSPQSGLAIDVLAKALARPVLAFDLSANVLVQADLWVRTVTLYKKSFGLASYRYGAPFEFGVIVPIQYREGQPFQLGLEDVQFIYPSLNPKDLVTGVVKQARK